MGGVFNVREMWELTTRNKAFSQPTCGLEHLEPYKTRDLTKQHVRKQMGLTHQKVGLNYVEPLRTRDSADKNVGLNQQNMGIEPQKNGFHCISQADVFNPSNIWDETEESGVMQLKCGCAFFKLNECFPLPRQNSLGDAGR